MTPDPEMPIRPLVQAQIVARTERVRLLGSLWKLTPNNPYHCADCGHSVDRHETLMVPGSALRLCCRFCGCGANDRFQDLRRSLFAALLSRNRRDYLSLRREARMDAIQAQLYDSTGPRGECRRCHHRYEAHHVERGPRGSFHVLVCEACPGDPVEASVGIPSGETVDPFRRSVRFILVRPDQLGLSRSVPGSAEPESPEGGRRCLTPDPTPPTCPCGAKAVPAKLRSLVTFDVPLDSETMETYPLHPEETEGITFRCPACDLIGVDVDLGELVPDRKGERAMVWLKLPWWKVAQ